MLRCPSCGVTVAGNKTSCPLCGGPLAGTPDPDSEIFPRIPKPRFTNQFILRLLGLIALAGSAICILINYALDSRIWWSLFVALGAGCLWAAAAIGISLRRDLMKNIAWQMLLIPTLSILWDWGTGWRGWSIDYVLPCVSGAALITMCLLARLLRLPLPSFASRLLLACLLGLVPAVLLACGALRVVIPSLICSALSIVALCALALFFGPMLRAELHRRLHL